MASRQRRTLKAAGRSITGGTASGRSLGSAAGGGGADAAANPFVLPSDAELFRMRDLERTRKEQERASQKTLKVHEKLPVNHRAGARRRLLEEAEGAAGGGGAAGAAAERTRARRANDAFTTAMSSVTRAQRRERETMSDFITKKREMFLVQMSLDTKREEIQKLERKAQLKEEALRKSEMMLEEDAIRFDAFLKQNDQEAYQALKLAEEQTKLKTAKLQEIKKLKYQLNALGAEISKLTDQLDECKRYKQFLDSLTPPEWLEAQRDRKRERQLQRRAGKFQERHEAWERLLATTKRQVEEEVEAARKRALREGRQPQDVDVLKKVREIIPGEPELDDIPVTSSGADLPMYFQEPSALLERFRDLEERNLFLITNNQEIEQQLEEARTAKAHAESSMAWQRAQLDETVGQLKEQISAEEKRAQRLRMGSAANSAAAALAAATAAARGGTRASRRKQRRRAGQAERKDPGQEQEAQQQAMLQRLEAAILKVYTACVADKASRPDRIGMLTQLEGLLEGLLEEIAAFDPEFVRAEEDRLERVRRDKVREERKLAEERQQAERVRISKERSKAPARRRAGKPLMQRSKPQRKEVVKEKRDPAREKELDDLKYLI